MLPGDEGAAGGETASVTFEAPDLRYDDAGYWSLTFYNADGWVETDPFVVNSRTATVNEDGSVTITVNGGPGAIKTVFL